RAGAAALAARQLAGRLPLPVPRLDLRHGRPGVQGQARARQPRGAAAHVSLRQPPPHRRSEAGLSPLSPHPRRTREHRSMAEYRTAPAGAGTSEKLLTWIDNRFPLSKLYKDHLSEYYAPKNFNIWYVFGGLATLVLVMQI